MTISFEINGCYTEHKVFFDEMAKAMQQQGHRVGIITGMREGKRDYIINLLGFTPDFLHLWGEFESISNGAFWTCEKMDQEDVYMHFSPDAREIKKYTGRWCLKSLDSGQVGKF